MTLASYLSYIASILFPNGNFAHVRTQKITRHWKSTLIEEATDAINVQELLELFSVHAVILKPKQAHMQVATNNPKTPK